MAQTLSDQNTGGESFQLMAQKLPITLQRILSSDAPQQQMLRLSRDLWAAASNREERIQCVNLMVSASNLLDEPASLAGCMTGFGYEAYRNKEFDVAQHAFSQASLFGSVAAMSNLAYMFRRGEVATAACGPKDIVELLLSGVVERDEYACINLALTLALLVGDDKAWEYADRRIMTRLDSASPASWWTELAARGETEGYLVLVWMMRHGLLKSSPLGTREELAKKVFDRLPGAPRWLVQDQ